MLLSAAHGLAQSTCYHFGSTPMAATWEASPGLLDCAAAPSWPQWHLFTPAHRAPGPHQGFNPGNAQARPRVLIAYRCTGFLLVPVVPVHIRWMGYVIDQPEIACAISP
ncbi:MAG: hypothetical protein ABIP94_23155 [Planctomycetota bacterium]